MTTDGAQPFESNWAYLKTELRWLDRLLMLAVSRQRQEDKTFNKVANTPADKVTSHWWKGIITVNRGIDDREGPLPAAKPKTTATVSYSQHLEDRIQASYKAGIILGLPQLRDRCALTEIEKNILLLALAPEVNRRYGRLYNYLQQDAGVLEDLPTVDLCLRLLCRNDQAWQTARARLTATNSLVNQGLVEWIGDEDGTLLSQQVRISDEVTNFLLANTPDLNRLGAIQKTARSEDGLLAADSGAESTTGNCAESNGPSDSLVLPEKDDTSVHSRQVTASWDGLVLPNKLIQQLQHLSLQAMQRQNYEDVAGLMVLLVGDSGTGKTLTAGIIAAEIGIPLTCIDLEVLSPESYPDVLTDTPASDPSLLLLKQGERWFGRTPQVHQTWLNQWWQWRKQHHGLTLLTAHTLHVLKPSWRKKFDSILQLPRPDIKARRRLWEGAFSPELKTDTVNWAEVAKQLPLTGGEILAIAHTTQLTLQARNQKTLTLKALKEAILMHHPNSDMRGIKGNLA